MAHARLGRTSAPIASRSPRLFDRSTRATVAIALVATAAVYALRYVDNNVADVPLLLLAVLVYERVA